MQHMRKSLQLQFEENDVHHLLVLNRRYEEVSVLQHIMYHPSISSCHIRVLQVSDKLLSNFLFKEVIHTAFESPSWKVSIVGDQVLLPYLEVWLRFKIRTGMRMGQWSKWV